MTTADLRVPGRGLSWATLLGSLGASIAMNIGAAAPTFGARLVAPIPPLFVIGASALLERVPLAGAKRWQRWGVTLSLVVLVLGSFITSYEHQRVLLVACQWDSVSAAIMPVMVDAMIVVSSACLSIVTDQRRATTVVTPVVGSEDVHSMDALPVPAAEHVPVPDIPVDVPVPDVPVGVLALVPPLTVSEVPVADVPAPAPGGDVPAAGRTRWAAAELRAAAHRLVSDEPGISRAAIAERLGVSDRRLRTVLNSV